MVRVTRCHMVLLLFLNYLYTNKGAPHFFSKEKFACIKSEEDYECEVKSFWGTRSGTAGR